MLRRLALGLFSLACAAAVAACSSSNTGVPSSGGVNGIGPNFTTGTIYVSDTTQNAIDIYTPSPAPSASPEYVIGGGNTTLNGPSYLAFDSSKRLYSTNYNAATKQASILIFQTFATGNVLPFGTVQVANGAQPHGIAMMPNNGGFVVTYTQPGGFFPNFFVLYSAFNGGSSPVNVIGGAATKLNNPIGVAVDAKQNVYVANSGATTANVTIYAVPSPSPTPPATPTPAPTPTPTPVPSGQPTPTPTPSPTPSALNLAPTTTVSCASGCMTHPTGMTLDGSGNLYVTDPDSGVSPAIYEFTASQLACAAPPCNLSLAPTRTITGGLTKLVDPTDVNVDAAGNLYVVDAGSGPNTSMLLIFAPGANGNIAPATAIALPAGTATGIALSP